MSTKERGHGTVSKYVVERCRCPECREAARIYNRDRQRAINRPDGNWKPYVAARETRKHLKALGAIGIGPKTVAELSGVSHGAISKILYGDYTNKRKPSRRIRSETAERILAVNATRCTGAQRIPATSTWVLLDDLVARGFTKTWLAQRLVGPHAVGLQLSHKTVRASTARAVEELHQSLKGLSGPGRRSRWDDRSEAA